MGLWKDKERKEWCYSFEYLGNSYAGRGFKTKGEARKTREERREQVRKDLEKQTQIDTAYDFKAIANEYLDEAERRFAKKTYDYKILVFKRFIEFCEETLNRVPPINEIDSQLLHSYLITRPSNNNYNAHRKDLCALFAFAIRRLKVIANNPFWDIEKMPHTPAPKRVPSQTDVLKLLMVAEPEEEKPFLMTVILTLARVDEVNRLRWTDVNFEKRTVKKWTRKRKGGALEPVTIAMNQDLYEVLWRLWQNRTQEEWVFYNGDTGTKYNRRQKIMTSLCKRAGIEPPFGFHALRHFMASLMADNPKISKKTIGDMLGHKSLTTTEIYLHSIDESQRAALESIEGMFSDENLVAADGCGFDKNSRNQAEKAATTI